MRQPSTISNVTWIYVFGFLAIILFASLWWPLSQGVSLLYSTLSTAYPTEMDDSAMTFVNAVWTYGPAIFIFVIIIWGFINSQKQRGMYY